MSDALNVYHDSIMIGQMEIMIYIIMYEVVHYEVVHRQIIIQTSAK